MSFVPGYEYDLFVSYASVDNHPPVGVSHGWVSNLIMELKRVLAEELGHSESASIWMDHQLAANDPITPTILDALERSATLLIILSKGYLESPWCTRERNAFLDRARDLAHSGRRVFLVEKGEIGWDEKPSEIRDVKGKAFWYRDPDSGRSGTFGTPCPRPEENEYYRRVADLAHDLADQLRIMAAGAGNPADLPAASSGTRIVLADVTDDLVDQREEVRRYLQQHGMTVVERFYPVEPQAFRQALQEDVTGAVLFVQLLSNLTGKRPPGAEHGYPSLQYEAAAAAGAEILQWYSPDLDVDQLDEGPQKSLLLKATVISEPFEHFKARVVQRAQPKPQPAASPRFETLVFVNHGSEDQQLAEQVRDLADELGLESTLPITSGRPSEIREALENCMRESDAMLLLYGNVPETWVANQLLQFRKFRNLEGKKRKGLAVYEGPPRQNKRVPVKLSDMWILDCQDGVDRSKVQSFLRECSARQVDA